MRRRLFFIIAGLSAILFVILAGIWIRTFVTEDDVRIVKGRFGAKTFHVLQVRWGGDFAHIQFVRTDNPFSYQFLVPSTVWRAGDVEIIRGSRDPSPQGITSWIWWDHYVDHQTYGPQSEVWRIQLRPWLPMLASAILPAILLKRFITRRREGRAGHCIHCGYDLRATPGRCPECGTVPASATGPIAT
jgi:hypothetical protein